MSEIHVHVDYPTKVRQIVDALSLAAQVVQFVYIGVMGWQVAKAVMPGLDVYEKALIRKFQRKFGKPKPLTQEHANDFVADVTAYVRDHAYDFRLDESRNTIPLAAEASDV